MAQNVSGASGRRWPIHSAHFWGGLLAGVGLGLLLAAALVELEMLRSNRRAWASLLGAVLFGIGGLVAARGQSQMIGGATTTSPH